MPGSGPFDDAEGGFLPDSKRIGLIDDIPPTLEGQTLVGGAPVTIRTLEEALRHAPRLIAVDGGADAALAAGMIPETVIGDLDSISDAARSALRTACITLPNRIAQILPRRCVSAPHH